MDPQNDDNEIKKVLRNKDSIHVTVFVVKDIKYSETKNTIRLMTTISCFAAQIINIDWCHKIEMFAISRRNKMKRNYK